MYNTYSYYLNLITQSNLWLIFFNIFIPGMIGVVINHRVFNNSQNYNGSIPAFIGLAVAWNVFSNVKKSHYIDD